jgi:hypothetical protein
MKLKTIFSLVGLLCWWCTACQSPPAPTPTIIPTLTILLPTPQVEIDEPVIAPTGQKWGQKICTTIYSVWNCQIFFTNGQVLGGDLWELWSPSGRYNLACVGTDSICSNNEVWDMATGQAVLQLRSNSTGTFAWDPEKPDTALYFIFLGETQRLLQYNFATGHKKYLARCPSWYEIKNSDLCQWLIAIPTPFLAPPVPAYPGQNVPSSSYP